MRKSLAILLALVGLSLGGVGYAVHSINAPREDVVFTREILAGDPHYADGLNVTCRNHYNFQVLWDSTLTFREGTHQADTRFTCLQSPYLNSSEKSDYDIFLQREYYSFTDEDDTGLNRAWQELMAATPPGEEGTREFRLKDYWDTYPYILWVYGGDKFIQVHSQTTANEGPDEDWGIVLRRKMMEFFKIPVLEEERVEITLMKGNDGRGHLQDIKTEHSADEFDFQSSGLFSGDAFYLYFDNRSREGNLVDTSQIPGGYGIYSIPLNPEKEGTLIDRLDPDKLAMVYALDETTYIRSLELSTDKTKLLLHTVEDGMYYVSVINRKDMTLEQKIPLSPMNVEVDGHFIQTRGDITLVYLHGKSIFVLGWENGSYGIRLKVPAPTEKGSPEGLVWAGSMRNRDIAFDGERLAVVGNLPEELIWPGSYPTFVACGLYMAVYDQQGLEYLAAFRSSLDDANKPFYNSEYLSMGCMPRKVDPIQIRWDTAT